MRKVPKIFHFVFGLSPQKEPFHLAHYLCIASCMAVNKLDAIYFHYKYLPYGEWWDRVSSYLVLQKVEENSFIGSFNYKNKSIEEYRYAHWADIIRLEILIEYGGVYADIDTIFVNEIPDWFYGKPFILGKEKVEWREEAARLAGGSLCNAWILAEKNSDFARMWLENLYKEFDGSWSNHSTFLPYRLSLLYPSMIHIEPERSFFYFDWTKEGIKNIFMNNVKNLDSVYSIHLWSHLWWNPKRTDFTYFHNRRLTINYVAFSNSTYSSIARRFLPPDVKFDFVNYIKERIEASIESVYLSISKSLKPD